MRMTQTLPDQYGHEDCGMRVADAAGCCLADAVQRPASAEASLHVTLKIALLPAFELHAFDLLEQMAVAGLAAAEHPSGHTPPINQLRI